MANPFTSKLRPVDSSPAEEYRCDADDCRTGDAKADGYTVLQRADPSSMFDRNRRGLAPPVDTFPNIDFSED